MSEFNNKIDFAVVFSVSKANPNGDPLDGNRPRIDYDGYGEVSDVCIKRKIRNRLQDMGEKIFVQSEERSEDGCKSLKDRADKCQELKAIKKDPDKYAEVACREWIDVRSFGQVFAFNGNDLSVGVRGPVTVQTAVSELPINSSTMQITKSVNGVTREKKSPDTMGSKHRVDFGVYKFFGSINVQLAEKTGFTQEDAQKIKEALRTLFVNDCSSARPDGSMEVLKLFWWEHNCKAGQYSSAKIRRSLHIEVKNEGKTIQDYIITADKLDGLHTEEIDGI